MYRIIGADGKEYGPVTLEQLRQWVAEGRANAQSRVQVEGSTEWRALGELPEFAAPGAAGTPLPPAQPAPLAAAPAPQGNNTMAVTAFVLSIFSLICCNILAPVGIILGILALSQLKKNPQQSGRGLAIAAIIISCIALIVAIVAVILVLTGQIRDFPFRT